MLASLVSLALLSVQDSPPVTFERRFTNGAALNYRVSATLNIEMRAGDLETFLPSRLDIEYPFSLSVKELMPEGNVRLVLKRPTFKESAEDPDGKGPQVKIEKINEAVEIILTPLNHIINLRNMTPKKPMGGGSDSGSGTDDDDGGNKSLIEAAAFPNSLQSDLASFLLNFRDDVHRLALNIGPLSSSLDLAPRLPFDAVKVGQTWKETAGYQPQKLRGNRRGEMAVQRLDYTYTYKGPMMVNGRRILRIEGALSLNSDLGAFVNQIAMQEFGEATDVDTVPLQLTQTLYFDLDPVTHQTLHAETDSKGTFTINLKKQPKPVVEERFTGHTVLALQPAK
ncbi:MAG: hypothetical protein JSS72_01285 [Armatimonadetes bacterium]|nr:hypothetical protein [Armatimonadota bacterium]